MSENKKWYDGALLVNRDPNWYGGMFKESAEEVKAGFETYFNSFGGHSTTDVMLCVMEQTAILPNEHILWRGAKYLYTEENGVPVDYKERLWGLYKCFEEYHIDPVEIFLDAMKKQGIRPWIAFRMNDAHFMTEETAFLRSDINYEAYNAGELLGTEAFPYFARCFNFKYPRYRNALLGYITEVVNKYDVFGVELDFMREIFCFDYKNDPDCRETMLEYIREIRRAVDTAGKKHGHEMKLLIRICRDPKDAYDFGFDIKAMCDEGLIDAVVPTARWSTTDSAIPIGKWRELLGEDIAIFGGIETLNLQGSQNKAVNSKAYAAAFFADGADGIYYNNHEYSHVQRNLDAWDVTRESCLEGRREFVVTWQDTKAEGNPVYKPLPMNADGEIELNIGKVKASDVVNVVIDFDGEGDVTLTACGKTVTGVACETVIENPNFKTPNKPKPVMTPNRPLSFDISGISTEKDITFKFSGNGKIGYINIIIEA